MLTDLFTKKTIREIGSYDNQSGAPQTIDADSRARLQEEINKLGHGIAGQLNPAGLAPKVMSSHFWGETAGDLVEALFVTLREESHA